MNVETQNLKYLDSHEYTSLVLRHALTNVHARESLLNVDSTYIVH